MAGCPGRLGKDRGCAAASFPERFAGALPDARPSSLRARLRDRARHLPRPQTGSPPDRCPEPGGVLVPHSGQSHRSGHRLQRGRGPRGGGHGRPLHRLPQRPRPQPARLPTGPPDRRRLRRGPVPLRLRRRAAGGHPDQRAHRAHHAARGPYVRRHPEDRIADALRRRHRSPAVAGLEARRPTSSSSRSASTSTRCSSGGHGWRSRARSMPACSSCRAWPWPRASPSPA